MKRFILILLFCTIFAEIVKFKVDQYKQSDTSSFTFLIFNNETSKIEDIKHEIDSFYFESDEVSAKRVLLWYETTKKSYDYERMMIITFGFNDGTHEMWTEPRIISFDSLYSVNYYNEYDFNGRFNVRLQIDNIMSVPKKTEYEIIGAMFINKLADFNKKIESENHKCCIYENNTAPDKYKLCKKCITYETGNSQSICPSFEICPISEKDTAQFLLVDSYWIPYCCFCKFNNVTL